MLELLIAQSDPANLALLAVIYWRLDSRLKDIRADLSTERSQSA